MICSEIEREGNKNGKKGIKTKKKNLQKSMEFSHQTAANIYCHFQE